MAIVNAAVASAGADPSGAGGASPLATAAATDAARKLAEEERRFESELASEQAKRDAGDLIASCADEQLTRLKAEHAEKNEALEGELAAKRKAEEGRLKERLAQVRYRLDHVT